MRSPTSSSVDTLRLGSRTRAMNATHRPIPSAVNRKHAIKRLKQAALEYKAYNTEMPGDYKPRAKYIKHHNFKTKISNCNV